MAVTVSSGESKAWRNTRREGSVVVVVLGGIDVAVVDTGFDVLVEEPDGVPEQPASTSPKNAYAAASSLNLRLVGAAPVTLPSEVPAGTDLDFGDSRGR